MSSRRDTFVRRARDLAPRQRDYAGLSISWRRDLLAGLTVGIVALPLALGFGVASGVGPTAGIITAIVAGVVAAIFGGSSVQVSGPTGAMAVVLVSIVARDGVSAVATVAVMAGVMVLGFGVVGLGRVINFVPWSVLEGFTLGIAVVIALQQVPLLLGESAGTGSSVLNSAWRAVAGATHHVPTATLLMGLGVIVIMTLMPRVSSVVPSSIVAVVVVTTVAELVGATAPTLGVLPRHLPAPRVPDLNFAHVQHLTGPALAVALLVAIESLLSARVADAMVSGSKSLENREMLGQGLANIACGLFGGMPATGAIARTAVNVRAGARTRVSAITHAVVILLVILLLAPVVEKIPLAVLGGVLVMTAIKMVDRVRVVRVLRAHRSETFAFALTAIVTVTVNLVNAIEVGLVVAGVLALRSLAAQSGVVREDFATSEGEDVAGSELLAQHIAVFRFDGALFFGAAPQFLESFTELAGASVVILRLRGLSFIDATGADVLHQIIEDLSARGITVFLKSSASDNDRLCRSSPVIARLAREGHVFTDFDSAVVHARRHVERHGHRLGQ